MKIPLQEAKAALEICSWVAATDVQESSQFVRLRVSGDKLTMSLTGALRAESEVTGSAGGKWTAYVERRAFKAFLDTASGKELELYFKDSLVLKCGQRLEFAPHTAISGYESWTPKSTFDLSEEQKLTIKTGSQYLPKNVKGSEHVEAIHFGKEYGIIATDTLYIFAVLGIEVKTSFYLPALLAGVLTKGKVGVEKNGIGVVLSSGFGFVYQPLSADLDRYPLDPLKAKIDEALKAKSIATINAKDLLEILRASSRFLLDKSEVANIESTKTGFNLTIDLKSGKFQRAIKAASQPKLDAPVNWPIERLTPWLDYVVETKNDAEISFARIPDASVFSFLEGKVTRVLVVADL